jgi:hypothetical protein
MLSSEELTALRTTRLPHLQKKAPAFDLHQGRKYRRGSPDISLGAFLVKVVKVSKLKVQCIFSMRLPDAWTIGQARRRAASRARCRALAAG